MCVESGVVWVVKPITHASRFFVNPFFSGSSMDSMMVSAIASTVALPRHQLSHSHTSIVPLDTIQ